MPDCHVVIVNWNGGKLLHDAVRSMMSQTARPEVWVVDNASTDGSADEVKALFPGIHLLQNRKNLGFAAGNNTALRELQAARYVLLLNNDAWFPEDHALADALAYMESHPEMAGACGRFEYPNGDFQRFYHRLPTPFQLMVQYGCGRYVKAWRTGPALDSLLMLKDDFTRPMLIEQPAFACVLMRGDCFRQTGLLDEEFPIFFNDTDYCWRWRALGFHWQYLPSWRVIHHQGASVKKLAARLRAELNSSAIRFARKHQPGSLALVQASVWLDSVWVNWRQNQHEYSARRIARGDHFFLEQS